MTAIPELAYPYTPEVRKKLGLPQDQRSTRLSYGLVLVEDNRRDVAHFNFIRRPFEEDGQVWAESNLDSAAKRAIFADIAHGLENFKDLLNTYEITLPSKLRAVTSSRLLGQVFRGLPGSEIWIQPLPAEDNEPYTVSNIIPEWFQDPKNTRSNLVTFAYTLDLSGMTDRNASVAQFIDQMFMPRLNMLIRLNAD